MGFFRQQQEILAQRLLRWQYERLKQPIPPQDVLDQQTIKLVDEAHRIAKKSGRNVLSIVKDLIANLRK
jgi:hypothetical protein